MATGVKEAVKGAAPQAGVWAVPHRSEARRRLGTRRRVVKTSL